MSLAGGSCTTGAGLSEIRRALELAAHILSSDPLQLPSQLTAFLRDDPAAENFVDAIRRHTQQPWLEPRFSARRESSRTLLRSCDGAGEVMHLAVSRDGGLAVSESFMGGLSVWDLNKGHELRHFDPPMWQLEKAGDTPQAFGRMAIAGDNIHAVGGTKTGGVRVFNLEAAAIVRTEWDTILPGRSVKLSRDNRSAIVIPDDQTESSVVRWNLDDFTFEYILDSEFVAGRSCAFTNDGAWLVTYSVDGEIVACCTEDTSRSSRSLGYPEIEIGPLAVTNSLEFLFMRDANGQVVRLNLQTRDLVQLPTGISDSIDDGDDVSRRRSDAQHDRLTDLLLSEDETYLAAAYSDGHLRMWHLPAAREPGYGSILAHDDRFACGDRITLSNRLATASRGGVINTWDVTAICELDDQSSTGGAITDVEFIKGGATVVASSHAGGLTEWAVTNGEQAGSRFLENIKIHCLQCLHDKRFLAAGGSDGKIHVVDADTLRIVDQWQAHDTQVSGLALTPDGRHLLTCSTDHTVRAWQIGNRQFVSVLQDHSQAVRKIALSPDARIVATAGWDETTVIWDWRTGEVIRKLSGHDGPVRDAAFVMDGRILATSSWDGILLWDCSTWEQAGALAGHTDLIEGLAAGPLPTQFVSCSNDRTVRVWDAETLTLVTVYTHECSVGACAVSPTESTACVGDAFGRVLFFDMHSLGATSPYASKSSMLWASKIAPGLRTK